MNGYQLFVSFVGLVSLAASIWAIWCVTRSKIRYKAAWIVGSLFGFVGVGIDWNNPDDLFLVFGAQIPPVFVVKAFAAQVVTVKALFPIGALVALGKSEFGKAGRVTENP